MQACGRINYDSFVLIRTMNCKQSEQTTHRNLLISVEATTNGNLFLMSSFSMYRTWWNRTSSTFIYIHIFIRLASFSAVFLLLLFLPFLSFFFVPIFFFFFCILVVVHSLIRFWFFWCIHIFAWDLFVPIGISANMCSYLLAISANQFFVRKPYIHIVYTCVCSMHIILEIIERCSMVCNQSHLTADHHKGWQKILMLPLSLQYFSAWLFVMSRRRSRR